MTDDHRTYYPLGMSCTHCGQELSAAFKPSQSSISIRGLRSLDYIHTATGKRECWRKGEAHPYDAWRASAAFDKAQRAAWEAEDAAIAEAEEPTETQQGLIPIPKGYREP